MSVNPDRSDYRGPTFHHDGHRLSLLLGDGYVDVQIDCPGESCEGLRDIGDTTEPVCIVEYNAAELRQEFLDCQQRVTGDEGTTIQPPIEIEWRDWGTDGGYFGEPEYEFWWRPVLEGSAT